MTDSTPENLPDAERLPELVADQRRLCAALVEAGGSQSRCIREDNAEELLEILEHRGAQIERLGDLLRRFGALLETDLPQADRQDLGRAVQEIREVVAGLIEQDEEGRRQLENSRDGIRREIDRLNRGRSATRSYQSAYDTRQSPGQWADRKG